MEPFSMRHHSLPQVPMEKIQDEHARNVALTTFGNPIDGRLATDFQQFLQNFQLHYLPKKLLTTYLNDFQVSNFVELNFSVNWSSQFFFNFHPNKHSFFQLGFRFKKSEYIF